MAIILVVVLVVFTVMAASIVSMSTSGARGAADHVNASAALFLAESGVEWAAKQLVESDDFEDCCDDSLQGSTGSINDSGGFQILESDFVEADDDSSDFCRIKVRGNSGTASRIISASVQKPSAEGAEGSIFDDPADWNTVDVPGFASGSLFPGDGVLFLRRNDGCAGRDYFVSVPDPASMLGNFSAGEEIFLATNHDVDASCGGPPTADSSLRFQVFLSDGSSIQCDWAMVAGTTTCPAPMAPSELTEEFDLVLALGNGFAATQVTEIRVRTLWNNRVFSVALSDTCIGSTASCLEGGMTGDDPVEEGSWDETP